MSISNALKWSFLSELATKAIQPIVFVVLARLLTPEDFGVMSSALMVMSFSQIFWEAGMGKALIQRQNYTDQAANVAFWVNIGLGVVIASVLFIAAHSIAIKFFHDERVTDVIRVMTAQVFLGAFSSVHYALLQKEMGFKKLFWVRFTTVSIPGMASIPLAWNGVGYWALVVGSLIGQTAQVIMLWNVSTWRPKISLDIKVAKELLKFSALVGVSGILSWFYGWADSLIVGMSLGSHDLGLYRTGAQLSTMIYALIFGPVIPVLYSHLSKINAQKKDLSEIVQKIMRFFVLMALPIAMLIFSIRNEIELYVFSDRWIGVGIVVGVMAITYGISNISSINGEAYRAIGKPKYETLVLVIPIPLYILVYITLASHGLFIFLIGRLLVMLLIANSIHLFFSKKLFGLNIRKFVLYFICVFIASSVFVLYRYCFGAVIVIPWVIAVMTVITGSLTLIIIIYYTLRNEILDLKRIILSR